MRALSHAEIVRRDLPHDVERAKREGRWEEGNEGEGMSGERIEWL
jgi:hypothetical protein